MRENGREDPEMVSRLPFGLPRGWYVVATGDELRPGRVVSRSCFGRELVAFRTKRGALAVTDAHCPHLGGHLGRIGSIRGEVLRCGFHGFCYDVTGTCVETGYGSPPPPTARLRRWESRERNGLVLVWFDPEGRPPSWEVPELEQDGWDRLGWRRQRIATHPQETTENSVDLGHFTQLHGFVDGSLLEPLRRDGPHLSIAYVAHRPYRVPGYGTLKLRVEYAVRVSGLGYSQVSVRVPLLRADLRIWVLPTPVDEQHIDLVLGIAVRRSLGPLAPIARHFGLRTLCAEVDQDLDAWQYKAYLDAPALAKGDGPIAAYRRWARQFYPV